MKNILKFSKAGALGILLLSFGSCKRDNVNPIDQSSTTAIDNQAYSSSSWSGGGGSDGGVLYALSGGKQLDKLSMGSDWSSDWSSDWNTTGSSDAAVLKSVTITGLQSGETILGMDFRPATGQLYGLGIPAASM